MRRSDEREADFQAAVIELAQLCGWLVYHTHDSRRSAAGWPDLTLVRNGHLIFAELKTTRGRVRPKQRVWLRALAQCPRVEVAPQSPASRANLAHRSPPSEALSSTLRDA